MNYKGIKDNTWKCCGCGIEMAFRGYSDNAKFCSNACQGKKKRQETLNKYREAFDRGEHVPRRWVYKILVERDGDRCSCCGITQWNNKPIRFWVDHIDGDASNPAPNNFRLICPNCDSQSETFGSKNRGRGRKARGLPMYG